MNSSRKNAGEDVSPDLPGSLSGLEKELKRLNSTLEKRNSYVHVLLRALLTGLGTAIGATVVTGIVFYLIYRIAEFTDSMELLRNVINGVR
jgi:hypothetical protein